MVSMGKGIRNSILSAVALLMVTACSSQPKTMNVYAPMPPEPSTTVTLIDLGQIEPSNGLALTEIKEETRKSCSFSKFHRKHTLGYEMDESRHIALKVSPSFDVFDPSDFETKVSLRFTKAIGGAANKRPKCTYGKGFYGLLPYATNERINFGGLFDGDNIKSFVEEKLEDREQRRIEREEKAELSI